MKIEIGAGINRHEGFIPCDISDKVGAEYVFNAEVDKFPFEDNSVDEVLAENLLEHFHSLDHFMSETWRVLKADCKLVVKVPHYQSYTAYFDPDHVRYFTPQSMIYWSRTTKGSDGRPVVRCEADFDVLKVTNFVNQDAVKEFPNLLSSKPCVEQRYWNVFDCIVFELKCVKPLRVVK